MLHGKIVYVENFTVGGVIEILSCNLPLLFPFEVCSSDN